MRFKKLNEVGYSGWSMSNNAVNAYEEGEKPLSKWSKQDILSNIKDNEKREIASKIDVNTLREYFLSESS